MSQYYHLYSIKQFSSSSCHPHHATTSLFYPLPYYIYICYTLYTFICTIICTLYSLPTNLKNPYEYYLSPTPWSFPSSFISSVTLQIFEFFSTLSKYPVYLTFKVSISMVLKFCTYPT